MLETIVRSLKEKLRSRAIKLVLSAGINTDVYKALLSLLEREKLSPLLGTQLEIVYDKDVFQYYDKFNAMLRTTDVLWTKPSELTFYCALGIPILLAPAVGMHEESNEQWLKDLHAGITPPGPVEYAHEWLFDMRKHGIFADIAWSAFLKVRKLGTYKIEEIVRNETFKEETTAFEP